MSATVELFGETFRLVEDPADMEFAFLEFAEIAGDVDAEETAGAAAVMGLLKAAIHADDWKAFKACCRKNKARTERDLMPIVVIAAGVREQAVEAETERPTPPPTVSSAGPGPTEQRSTGGFSQQATRPGDPYQQNIERLNAEGRPDLALVVADARSHRTA